jgi:SAM-dependent methyltransferase
MHKSVQRYCEAIRRRYPAFFNSKAVLDCGSLDINGNNRYLFHGGTYTGIDIVQGRNVDVVGRVHLYNPSRQFDVVISTEMLEHDQFFPETLAAMFRLLKPGGLLLITAAGYGRREHGTTATSPADSPLTNDYYHNITPADIVSNLPLESFTEWNISYQPHDIRFYGIKK